jgi:hypothetical protein
MPHDEFERIKPATYELSAPATHAPDSSRAVMPVRGTALLLGALLVLAAAVIFVLPDIVAERSAPPTAGAAAAASPSAPAPQASGPAAAAPYAQAQAERERAAAKTALDGLLATQYELQQRGAGKWAAEEFAAATALAHAGDEAYRAGSFQAAETQYRAGQQAMQALLDGVDARLADRLARGDAALTADDAVAATAAFGEALAIDAANARAQHGLARATARPGVLAQMARGAEAESAGDSAAAAAAYREALALDGEYAAAGTALAALQARVTTNNYQARLSAGYAALSGGRLNDARSEFQAALKLRPSGAEASDGLQQTEFQLTQQRMAELLRKAEQAVAAEQWAAAVPQFDALLAIDAALSTAREGKRNAERRLALDRALEQITREPERLNQEKTRANAVTLIDGAQALGSPGPRLQGQLATARRLLQEYSTPVALRLRSDGKTDVTVLRVGSFGPLTEKSLELLPGNYVAVGQRGGYRDVRVEFVVRAGQAAADVTVQCAQKI